MPCPTTTRPSRPATPARASPAASSKSAEPPKRSPHAARPALASMTALEIYAGPRARQHLLEHGLCAADVRVVPAAAGGPKGLVLNALDRVIFGEWAPGGGATVHP